MTRQQFSYEMLSQCIHRHIPESDEEMTITSISTGNFNTSYFVALNEQEYVLRIAPLKDAVYVFYEKNMMRQEPGIHALLLEKTTIPVANIIAYDDSGDIIPHDFLLMERLPGKPFSSSFAVDEAVVLQQIGSHLAQAHQLTAKAYGYLGEHAPMPPQSSWNEAFWLMWHKMIDDVAAVGYYTPEECSSLLTLLDKHEPLFDRTVPSSLLHMDVWGQNILVNEQGNVTGLLDWDRALWGDPEIEFAVLDYCGISKPAFWEGYGQQRDRSKASQVRNIFYLLYEIQKYIVIRHERDHDPETAKQYKQQVAHVVRQFF